MIYSALGDSITYGEDASSFARAYPQLTVANLNFRSRKERSYDGYVLARPGWTSYDLLQAVTSNSSSAISHSSLISIWIGGVDLANAALFSLKNKQPLAVPQALNEYSRNLHAILHHIRNTSHARVICCTQYNPFPNSSLAIAAINRLNDTISATAHRWGVKVAPAHTWFEGKQADLIYGYRRGQIEDAMSGFRPIHPNDQGHRVIATGLTPYLLASH